MEDQPQANSNEQSRNNQNRQKPVESFRDGAIQVAVWERRNKENGTSFYEIQRTRSYTDKNGDWQKTNLISDRDILKSRRLEDQAYEAIQRLKSQDRNRADYQRAHDGEAQQPQQVQSHERDDRNMDNNQLQQNRDQAMANVPEQQPSQQQNRSMHREP